MSKPWNYVAKGLGVSLLGYLGNQYLCRKNFTRASLKAERELLDAQSEGPLRDLSDLPAPIQRFLNFSQMDSAAAATAIRLELKGQLRLGPHRKWRPFKASQMQMLNPPGLIWQSETHLAPAVKRMHREAFVLGQKRETEGLVACFKRPNKQAELWSPWSYYLVGLAWMPAAFLAPDWKFEVLDARRVQIELSQEAHPQLDRVKGILEIASDGRLLSLESTHHREVDGVKNWVFLYEGWEEHNGLKVPARGRAVRRLNAESSFDYLQMQIQRVSHLSERSEAPLEQKTAPPSEQLDLASE